MTEGVKPQVAFYWCASCGGCEEAVVDLAEDILGVVDAVEITLWPVALDFKRADLEARPAVDAFAAFTGVVARKEIVRRADVVIVGPSLTALLPYCGLEE